MKTYKEIKQHYKEALNTLYPEREIEALFFIALEYVLGWNRTTIRLEINSTANKTIENKLLEIVSELQQGKPIQYIFGYTEFFGNSFKVNNDVLIPRQETEELVSWIISSIENSTKKTLIIADIGTGSGCIPISLQLKCKNAKVYGFDVSENALSVAKENNKILNSNVQFHCLDILKNDLTSFDKFDVIVSNPPYVLESEKKVMHENVLNYEPHLALFVENTDPLIFYKRIAEIAKKSLKSNGFLFFEINEKYGKEIVNLLLTLDFNKIELKKDINGKNRMIRCVQ